MSAPGFTLIELSVAILAGAALLAVAVPPLRLVRQESGTTRCQANLQRIHAASLTYAVEDDTGLLIPIASGDASSGLRVLAHYGYGGRAGWGNTKPMGTPVNSPFAGGPLYRMGPRDRPLNRLLVKGAISAAPVLIDGRANLYTDWASDTRLDLSPYHCPNDAGFPGMHHQSWRDSGLPSYDFYGTSYAVPFQAIAIGSPPYRNSTVYQRRPDWVPSPAVTIAYVENAGLQAFRTKNPAFDQCSIAPLLEQVAYGWHGTAFEFNVAFVDGAVSAVRIQGSRVDESAYCASPYELCRCLMIRGDGWRFDTYPNLPIAISKPTTGGGVGQPDWDIVQ
jgi:prepilin-type N-terminal cleavage/methylation domain-containing protein